MSEFIGSRISLISKSDIKYIGTLHEINSENHTVALENVKSYGTEGRRPGNEVAGSDFLYEYIVFRGSDVKDLNIVSSPPREKENEVPAVPDDPAILGSARPSQSQSSFQQSATQQSQYHGPPQGYAQQQQFGGYQQAPPPPNHFQNQPPRFQGPGGPHGFPGMPGAVPGHGMGYGPPPPPPGYGMGYVPPLPGQGFPNQPAPPGMFPAQQQQQQQQQMPIGPPAQQRPQGQQQQIGSGSSTPQPGSGQSNQAPSLQKPLTELSGTPAPPITSGPPPPVESKPSPSAATAPPAPVHPLASKPIQKVSQNRVAVPLPPPAVLAAKPPQKPSATSQVALAQQTSTEGPIPQQQTFQDATQVATAAVAAAMAKLGTQDKQARESADNLAQKVNQMRIQDSQQRGRGRARGSIKGGAHAMPRKTVEVPKEDYDFESANAKFNKEELVKEAIASSSSMKTSPPSGSAGSDTLAAEAMATTANGHERATANGMAKDSSEVVIPLRKEGCYNKKSSFFDNISSDLRDRMELQEKSEKSGGQSPIDGRAMRREERTKNMETFGQGSVDGGFRGGYRGGRGRARGGYGRSGGFRGGRGGLSGFEGRGRGRGRGGAGGGVSEKSTVPAV
ncbi:hypothetical protein M433DRAFT_137748 [Acidomyces richmondensis BFW]|nr:hypothetical protein M433DRAFT_137748 [Acidomyces richmondensis BFW]